jgi:hypothetical protein
MIRFLKKMRIRLVFRSASFLQDKQVNCPLGWGRLFPMCPCLFRNRAPVISGIARTGSTSWLMEAVYTHKSFYLLPACSVLIGCLLPLHYPDLVY